MQTAWYLETRLLQNLDPSTKLPLTRLCISPLGKIVQNFASLLSSCIYHFRKTSTAWQLFHQMDLPVEENTSAYTWRNQKLPINLVHWLLHSHYILNSWNDQDFKHQSVHKRLWRTENTLTWRTDLQVLDENLTKKKKIFPNCPGTET